MLFQFWKRWWLSTPDLTLIWEFIKLNKLYGRAAAVISWKYPKISTNLDPVLVYPVWFIGLIRVWWRRMALKHLVNFGTINGLPPNMHQAIPWTNTDML